MDIESQYKTLDKICPFRYGQGSKKRTRHEFFENICTEIQAYILGLHTADGYVDYKKQMFRYIVQSQDIELIYLLKDTIGVDARLWTRDARSFIYNNKSSYSKESCGIDIYSKKIRDDLIKLKVGPNKTYNEIPLPNLDETLIRHFIRGYFDGDGCFTWGTTKATYKEKTYYKIWNKVVIISKTKTLLANIQTYLATKGINSSIDYKYQGDYWSFEIRQKESILTFFHFIYDDSNFYLKRKYEKFNHYVNTEVSQLIAEHRNAQKVNVSNSNNPSKSVEHPDES